MTDIEVALPFWLDRPDHEATDVALAAADTGFAALWIGEMATYDAFALATSIGLRTPNMTLKVGPLAVGVRGPVGLALGVSSVASLTGCRVDLALGASSPAIVAAGMADLGRTTCRSCAKPSNACGRYLPVRGSNTAAVTSTAADSGCAVRRPIRELRWGRLDLA